MLQCSPLARTRVPGPIVGQYVPKNLRTAVHMRRMQHGPTEHDFLLLAMLDYSVMSQLSVSFVLITVYACNSLNYICY